MIRVAIVEDDKGYAEILKKYIARYETESKQRFQIYTYQDGEDIVENYRGNYDIILMDIEMQFMDGMTAAEHIRKVDSEVVIIFITNMPQYAMKGYAVEALDYVLKPINYYSFSQRIERAINRMMRRQKRYISISNRGQVQKIDLTSLYYVEVQDHNLFFHLDGEVIQTRGTMKEIEQQLESESFFRCNKCYMINLEYISELKGSSVIVGDDEVQVSRSKKKVLLDALNNYMNEVSK